MKPNFLVTAGFLLGVVPSSSHAQQVVDQWLDGEDAYDAHFGDGAKAADAEEGPQDLQEALEQGRGYRLGGGGRYSATPSKRAAEGAHRVADGETLWDISARYYGDPMQWPRLWSYNPEITNPHWIYPDSSVRLSSDGQADGEPGAPSDTAAVEDGTPKAAGRIPMQRAKYRARKTGSAFLRDQGFLGPEGMAAAGTVTGSRSERVMLALSDQVYVRFPEGAKVQPGEKFSVFRRAQKIEREPGAQGVLVRVYGTVAIRSYDAKRGVARGVITEALVPIERGSSVARVERQFLTVAPRRNEADVVAHLVSSLDPHMLLSDQDVAFLDVGKKQGVQTGNRFFVVRTGDPYLDDVRGPAHHTGVMPLPKYKADDYPKEVVAELRVVRVQEESSVVLITRADVDLVVGDLAEMRKGF